MRRRIDISVFFLFCISFLFVSCTSKKEGDSPAESTETKIFFNTKFDQYYLQGEQLYAKNCSNCHQKNGTGLGLLFPPLNKSDFMDNNFEKVICLMKHGVKGELTVNGKKFNKKMPGISSLTDLEIAEIATYIYNTWEHKRGLVDVNAIQNNAIVCKDID